MTLNAFILIVGLVLLTMSAIIDSATLLKWLYEQDQRHKRTRGGE